mmetsp:Transcript_42904/g.167680  ORF Transcript_42904/g.167680 Transcript_42904/m.167680 type:complete len:81 (-) Transcript_42904:1473-1715(-)
MRNPKRVNSFRNSPVLVVWQTSPFGGDPRAQHVMKKQVLGLILERKPEPRSTGPTNQGDAQGNEAMDQKYLTSPTTLKPQ